MGGEILLNVCQCPPEGGGQLVVLAGHEGPFPGKALATGPQIKVGGTTLPLQAMDQVANALHQPPHLQKVFQVTDLTLPGGHQEFRSRRWRGHMGMAFVVHGAAPGVITQFVPVCPVCSNLQATPSGPIIVHLAPSRGTLFTLTSPSPPSIYCNSLNNNGMESWHEDR